MGAVLRWLGGTQHLLPRLLRLCQVRRAAHRRSIGDIQAGGGLGMRGKGEGEVGYGARDRGRHGAGVRAKDGGRHGGGKDGASRASSYAQS